MDSKTPGSIEEYISKFESDVQKILREVLKTITSTAPQATPGISYGMPAFKLKSKPLVYFAAYKNHIGFYATPTGHSAFALELSKYKQGKGSVQFPIDQPMPLKLIKDIVKFRVEEVGKK